MSPPLPRAEGICQYPKVVGLGSFTGFRLHPSPNGTTIPSLIPAKGFVVRGLPPFFIGVASRLAGSLHPAREDTVPRCRGRVKHSNWVVAPDRIKPPDRTRTADRLAVLTVVALV